MFSHQNSRVGGRGERGTSMASDVKSPADLVRGHVPVLPPRWVRNVPRLEEDVVEAFRGFLVPAPTPPAAPLCRMSPASRPGCEPIGRLVGRALTVKAPPGDSLT